MSSRTFRALQERNARLFFAGMLVSNVGTWLQATAQVLLVRDLGGGGAELGLVTALQFLPLLVLGLWAGSVADRVDRRRLTIATQIGMGVQAIVLGVVDLSGVATIPIVAGLSLILGLLTAVDNPARRSLATELVEPEDLGNVLSLNTAVMTGSRVFGPALAALLVGVVGTGWCFVGNGVSFLVLIGALVAIDPTRLHRAPPAPRSATPVRDGLRAVWADPVSRRTLVLFTVVATFAYNYPVSLPLLVSDRLDEPDRTFGVLLSVISVGSVVGSLLTARLREVGERWFIGSMAVLAVATVALSLTTDPLVAALVCVPFGAGSAAVVSSSNVILQTRTTPDMRGRVLALGAVAFLGSTPIGGPITGVIGDAAGAVWATLYGGLVTAACLVVALVLRARRPAAPPSDVAH